MSLAVAILADSMLPYIAEINTMTEKVRESIDYTRRFITSAACEEFVRSVRYEHILIIVTPDKIDDIFTKNIHQIRRVQSIFLFDPQATMDAHEILNHRRSSYKVCTIKSMIQLLLKY